jgi:hypothetical protein
MSRVPNILANGPGNLPDADKLMTNFDWLTNLPTSSGLTIGGSIGIAITTGLVTITTSGNAGSLVLENTGGRGGGVSFKNNGTDVGMIGSSGLWLGSSASDLAVSAQTGKNFSVYFNGGTAAGLTVNTSGQTLVRDGTISLPGLSYISDPDTGLFRSASNQLQVGLGGEVTATFDKTSVTFYASNSGTPALRLQIAQEGLNLSNSARIYNTNGTTALPAYSWGGDTNTGLTWSGTDQFDFVAGGATSFRIGASDVRAFLSVIPDATNTINCGGASNKWALVRGTTITSGDLRFENDWVFIEGDRVGLPEDGVILVSPAGKRFRMTLQAIDDKTDDFKKTWAKRELAHFENVDPRCDCEGACIHDPAVVQEVFKVKKRG